MTVTTHTDSEATATSTPWQARFITGRGATGEVDAPAPYLRTTFTAEDRPVRATLRVTALGLVEARLNGSVVGDARRWRRAGPPTVTGSRSAPTTSPTSSRPG